VGFLSSNGVVDAVIALTEDNPVKRVENRA
jgi:hypothetical protein